MIVIETLISNFSIQNLQNFFRSKIDSYKPDNDDFDHIFKDEIFDKYESITKIGDATIENDEIVFIASKTNDPLTERSGKKKQYEIAKTILKQENVDAALFVFYDANGNFRFSFVKANYLGIKRDYTDFKRYSYFVSPKQTNKTFIKQVGNCNFNSLDEIIKSFSVEPLNKAFYQEIATAFYGLIGGKIKINTKEVTHQRILQLPSVDQNDGKKFQEFAVRLIGRTIFCWFLKNKKSEAGKALIPEEWLLSETVIQCGSDNYYHTILEKLFFLILNKKVEDRKPYSLPKGHEDVPFLNGGLFEAQEDDFFPKNSKGIHQFLANLVIPNEWFENLFKVLEQYNFTIDENSINDSEVSIDPEMLGTIFENLLAEIDPDTEKSARKSTGSFYTPREIVDYMVEQSLLNYLKNKTGIDNEELLQSLFKEGTENPFDDKPTKAILQALSDVKILDPACGSGAFPMGALHKIIVILKKLDRGAEWWKQKQLEKIDNAIVRKALKEKLDHSTSDYARKLGVIQHSIYGVDIQPIASEISKLRSFLSLIIDENIDDTAKNRGVEPLPNLEFKFVTANSLVGLESDKNQTTLDFGDNEEILVELQKIRNEYLQASPLEKDEIKIRFRKVQDKINSTGNTNNLSKRESQLYHWKPFDNESSPWFDSEWIFGIEKFDIIIGNPPYVSIRTKSFNNDFKEVYKKLYSLAVGQFDLYILFIEKANSLLSDKGVLNYIIPTRFLSNETFTLARKYIYKNCRVKLYLDAEMPFESANVEANSLLFIKNGKQENVISYKYNVKTQKINLISEIDYNLVSKLPFSIYPFIIRQVDIDLVNKIMSFKNSTLDKYLDITRGFEFGYNHESIHNQKNEYPLIKPESLGRYIIEEKYEQYVTPDFTEKSTFKTKELFKKTPKLLTKFISNDIVFSIDNIGFVNTNVIYNCHLLENSKLNLYQLLGYLNSKLVSYWFKISFLNLDTIFPHIQKNQLNSIVVPCDIDWDYINKLSAKILELKNNKKPTEDLEEKIDMIVYKFYNLNYDEVLLIEPQINLNKTEYDNYKID